MNNLSKVTQKDKLMIGKLVEAYHQDFKAGIISGIISDMMPRGEGKTITLWYEITDKYGNTAEVIKADFIKVGRLTASNDQLRKIFEQCKEMNYAVYSDEGDVRITDLDLDETGRFKVTPLYYRKGILKAWGKVLVEYEQNEIVLRE